MIELTQQHVLFDDPPDCRVCSHLRLGHFVGKNAQPFFQDLRLDLVFRQPLIEWRLEPEDLLNFGAQSGNIPLFWVGARRASGANNRVDGVVTHIDHDIIDSLGIHDLGALFIDDLALIIHHIIVLHDLFAGVVIARFDLLLRSLDRL